MINRFKLTLHEARIECRQEFGQGTLTEREGLVHRAPVDIARGVAKMWTRVWARNPY